MMTTIAAKLGALVLAPSLFFGAHGAVPNKAVAQAAESDTSCLVLTHDLSYGSRDRGTDGEVTELQAFLRDEGYLSASPTGFYGASTMRAVASFQRDQDIRATGTVGSATRAEIESVTCDEDADPDLSITGIDAPASLLVDQEGTWTVRTEGTATGTLRYSVTWGDENQGLLGLFRTSDEATQSSATFTHTYGKKGTYTPEFTVTDDSGRTVTKAAASVAVSQEAAVTISSLSPNSGASGTAVTITGTGFASSSQVYVGGVEAAAVTVNSGTSITATIPTLAARAYDVAVVNGDSKSNSLRFTVTKAAATRLSVSGIDAPRTLEAGAEGTWTVRADSNASGNLHYSVVWGDEGTASRMASQGMTQSSSAFTHSYQEAGTYMPKFTVSDDFGHSASVSASVRVTGAR
jgi:peptidoglycan hydrolase-like protein with peptidoglycan-binding domain